MLVYKCCSTLLAIFSYNNFFNYWLYFLLTNFAWRPTFSLNMLTDIEGTNRFTKEVLSINYFKYYCWRGVKIMFFHMGIYAK